ncbi:MAG: hypothetical protein D8M58_01680 [Calditrichaeota bacterium]|nr:MAG: hypothetical protein DWQ03_05400 [Calditrichota bacterium]MBL1204078.1 hypothetical protein [Calditrichota bacterium]
MKIKEIVISLLILICMLIFAQMFRFTIVVSDGDAYKLDRWTGDVYFIYHYKGEYKVPKVNKIRSL